MSSFTGPLTITEISADDELWRLDEDLVYYKVYESNEGVVIYKSGEIVVPARFISDGASVPKFLERMWPRWGKWRRPAILHDYLCGLIAAGIPHDECPTRHEADALFFSAMATVGVKEFDRLCLYLGARLATWFPQLEKGNVKNPNVNDEWWAEQKASKQPAIILNKEEIIYGVALPTISEAVEIKTDRGTISADVPPAQPVE